MAGAAVAAGWTFATCRAAAWTTPSARCLTSGFRKARNIRSGGQQWDLWYDERGRGDTCVGFTSYNGRVTDVRTFSSRDC